MKRRCEIKWHYDLWFAATPKWGVGTYISIIASNQRPDWCILKNRNSKRILGRGLCLHCRVMKTCYTPTSRLSHGEKPEETNDAVTQDGSRERREYGCESTNFRVLIKLKSETETAHCIARKTVLGTLQLLDARQNRGRMCCHMKYPKQRYWQ